MGRWSRSREDASDRSPQQAGTGPARGSRRSDNLLVRSASVKPGHSQHDRAELRDRPLEADSRGAAPDARRSFETLTYSFLFVRTDSLFDAIMTWTCRLLCLLALAAFVAVPVGALAAGSASNGTLAVKDGDGTLYVALKGALIGTFGVGRLIFGGRENDTDDLVVKAQSARRSRTTRSAARVTKSAIASSAAASACACGRQHRSEPRPGHDRPSEPACGAEVRVARKRTTTASRTSTATMGTSR